MGWQHFHNLCGVAKGQLWLDPKEVQLQEETGEWFYTLDFQLGISTRVNQQIFQQVVNSVMQEIVSVLTLRVKDT
jgi:hypothetical protein